DRLQQSPDDLFLFDLQRAAHGLAADLRLPATGARLAVERANAFAPDRSVHRLHPLAGLAMRADRHGARRLRGLAMAARQAESPSVNAGAPQAPARGLS